jgi:hypothetical protein
MLMAGAIKPLPPFGISSSAVHHRTCPSEGVGGPARARAQIRVLSLAQLHFFFKIFRIVLGPLAGHRPRRQVGRNLFRPGHPSDFAAALTGQQQHSDDAAIWLPGVGSRRQISAISSSLGRARGSRRPWGPADRRTDWSEPSRASWPRRMRPGRKPPFGLVIALPLGFPVPPLFRARRRAKASRARTTVARCKSSAASSNASAKA